MKPLRILLLLLPILAGVLPAHAHDFTLTDVKIGSGIFTLTIPSLEVKGSSLSETDFRRLVDGSDLASLPERLGAFNAATLKAPTLTTILELEPSDPPASYTYEMVTAENIVAGKIAKLTAQRGSAQMTNKGLGPVESRWGTLAIVDCDMKAQAEVMLTTRTAGTPPQFRQLIGSYSIQGMEQSLGKAGKMKIGAISGSGTAMSAGFTPLLQRYAGFMAMAKEAEAAKREGRTAAANLPAMADMLSMWEDLRLGANEAQDIDLTFNPAEVPNVKAEAKGNLPGHVEMRIATMTWRDTGLIEDAGYQLTGLSIKSGPFAFSIGSIATKGFSFAPLIAALRDEFAKGRQPAKDFPWVRAMPRLGSFSIDDVKITAPPVGPAPRAPAAPALDSYGLRKASVAVRQQENGIPTDMRIGIEGLNAPLPNNSSTKDLWAMGYRRLNLSSSADIGWNRDTSEIAVREIALDSADMLRLKLSGHFGNATRDLFSGDAALAQVAGLGLTAKALDARLDNLGLAEKLLDSQARKSGRKPEDLRSEFGMLAALALPTMLGDSDSGKALSGALARFIAKPGHLTLKLSAKSPSGLGLADVIGIADPKAVLNKINVEARAE